MLDELQLSATVEGLTFKANSERLAIHNLEENAQVVLANLLGIVKHVEVHLLARRERATTRLNFEDVLVKDLLLESLFLAWSARVGPRLHLNLAVIWHLEVPVCLHTAYVLKRKSDLARL